MDDKWKMFKNYMHNELGITKEDIRGWIKESVKEEARKIVKEAYEKNPIPKIIEDKIELAIYTNSWSKNYFTKEVINATAEILAKDLKIVKKDEK